MGKYLKLGVMSMAYNLYCSKCGKKLNIIDEVKDFSSLCDNCISAELSDEIMSRHNLSSTFRNKWILNLFVKYYCYIKENGISLETKKRQISKAKGVFKILDDAVLSPREITIEHLNNAFEQMGNLRGSKTSILAFLNSEKLIFLPNNDDLIIDSINRTNEKFPNVFQRLVKIYLTERLEYRKKQISNNERKPLSLMTMKTDVELHYRFVKWIVENFPSVDSWAVIQEEHIQQFLLSLPPRNREIVRKDINVLFKFAKKKRIIAHVPIIDFPSRELPSSIQVLDLEDQKKVASTIKDNMYTDAVGCLLASFCFYHGLSSKEIREIKTTDVDVDNKMILFENRPPIYLMTGDLVVLKEYAEIRTKIRNSEKKQYLILSSSLSEIYLDKPVSKRFVTDKVKGLTGHTPKVLRVTCFDVMASYYGPQILIEAFGLSLTQASRYGKFEEYLIEEQIKNQYENSNNT